MAIAVIGGLLSSTLLSLLFVPAVFSVMDDIAAALWRVFGRFVGDAEPAAIPSEGPDQGARPRQLPIAAE
jgi:HAE1 family hydrophobic/amphiphilic exporter-1